MFNKNFYPTPVSVIELMVQGINFYGKYVCEPQGGKGDIIDYVKNAGAEGVCTYEIEEELIKILSTKCQVLGYDWLEAKAEDISHVDYIIMNPPFDKADEHILHAWEIAPEGCEIIAICNSQTIKEDYTNQRRRLKQTIKNYGSSIQYIEEAFTSANGAERSTNVEIAFFKLFKPGTSETFDYEGFYLDEEPEHTEGGIIAYNEVREIVGRYVMSLKAFDKLKTEMDNLREQATSVGLGGYYSLSLNSRGAGVTTKSEFLKELQKAAWEWIFRKLNLNKMVTTEVKEKLNKFVQTQTKVPFTVKNVYQMINIIAGTYKENMDKALVNVFDSLTERYHENRYSVEGWKTNSAHCINKKFIYPRGVKVGYSGQPEGSSYEEKYDRLCDLQKAMAYMVGDKYEFKSLYQFFQAENVKLPFVETEEEYQRTYRRYQDWKWKQGFTEEEYVDKVKEILKNKVKSGVDGKKYKEFGKWYDFGYFMIKVFKKGTIHCKFKDDKHWELLNRRVNEIKGFPLPEKI